MMTVSDYPSLLWVWLLVVTALLVVMTALGQFGFDTLLS